MTEDKLQQEQDFVEKVMRTIKRWNMLSAGDTVVVGVSGGADSVALLHALWSVSKENNIKLIVGHLNHGIRGEDADRDARFVEELAAKFGLEAIVSKVDIPKLSRIMKLGLEEAARKVRYDFLEGLAKDSGAARIAVAHTADDQAETVLYNIIRGTGPEGLAGVPVVRGKIIRPLINTTRTEVEHYLRANKLEWRFDATNLDISYTRNRIRLELIPYLEEKFNPMIKEALLNLSELVRDESEFVKNTAEEAFQKALKDVTDVSVTIDAGFLMSLPKAIVRRLIRYAIKMMKGDLKDVEFHQVERIVTLLEEAKPFSLTLPSGVIYAKFENNTFTVFKQVPVTPLKLEHELNVPGITNIPELEAVIEVKKTSPDFRPSSPTQAVIDSSKVKGKLVVRTWKPGDRIQPLGMSGHKKLQDIFTDEKIPRPERWRVPILVDDEKIIWVVGLAVSELVRIDKETTSAFLIQFR